MDAAAWIVTAAGLAVSGFILWFFFGKKRGVEASVASSGVQEARVTVKGGYTPDLIMVQAGRPVRLTFTRQETAACSEMIVFPDFQKSAALPPGEDVTLEFKIDKPGEYPFSCQMGMLRGKLIAR
ncbi:MAG: cupredoxin domain-containing protein [Candidatus Tectomicrobia bacterium]|nr:cupredoxin domain-containing protein [Candidatus Tectomicrobia bacterium]